MPGTVIGRTMSLKKKLVKVGAEETRARTKFYRPFGVIFEPGASTAKLWCQWIISFY